MTTTSTDLLNDYARQIRVVTECAHALLWAKESLATQRLLQLDAELRDVIDNVDCAGYIAQGSNETARKDRRQLWMLDHHALQNQAVVSAEHDVAEAEIALEEARYRRTLLRLSLEADHDDA